MPSRLIIALLAGVALMLRAPNTPAQSATGSVSCASDMSVALARLRAVIDTAAIPGAALSFLNRGRVVGLQGIGYADSIGGRRVDENTVFEAASLGKTVIAYAALRLVDSGRLSLDVPLVQYLAYADLPSDPRARLITARMVLSHTTGLQNERIGDDTLRLSFTPGARFQYSGEGYVFLGRVIERITQLPLAPAIDQLVFRPLGMRRSSFVWERRFDGNPAVGHGSFGEPKRPTRPSVGRPSTLQTTAADFGTFLVAILRGTGLRAPTWRAMISPAVDVAPSIQWALGWGIESGTGGTSIWHHGDNSNTGFTAFTLLNVPRGCGFVYFANSVSGLSIANEVAAVVPGSHPSTIWIGYDRFTAPSLVVRRKIGRTLRRSGAAAAIAEFRRLQSARAPGVSEGLLNSAGYMLLSRGDASGAILVFEENVRAYPASANVYDSLGDAYLAAGRDVEARNAFARSVQMDPANSHARRLADSLGVVLKK